MTAMRSTGLGGGSLVYQGMSLEPTKEIFNTHFPVASTGTSRDGNCAARWRFPAPTASTSVDVTYIARAGATGPAELRTRTEVADVERADDVNHAHTVIRTSMPGMGADIASTMMVGYGVSDTRGSFRWDAASGRAELHRPAGGDGELIEKRICPTAERIISAGGAKGMLTDTNTMVNFTWHSLGGACMGTVCEHSFIRMFLNMSRYSDAYHIHVV
jgi:hypothetical protein